MPIRVLTPDKFIQAVNAEGCDITLDQLKSLVVAMTKIGVRQSIKRFAERLHGRDLDAQTRVVEELLDQDEPFLRKSLRASLDAFLNRSFAIGRWFEDEAPNLDDTLS